MTTSSGSAAGVPSGMTTATRVQQGEHWFPEPTEPARRAYVWMLVIAQFIFFVALLGPAMIGVAVKITTIVPAEGVLREEAAAVVASVGAAGAVVANVVFGRLSDRTTAKWGRRRPWIVTGTVVMTLGLAVMAAAPNVPLTALGWLIAQLGANATLAPFIATLSDQVPKVQRGAVAAVLGIAQNVGVLGGSFVAQQFQTNMWMMLVAPAIVALVAMFIFVVVLPDRVLPNRPPRMTLREWVDTFWVNPVRQPDFAFAWWSRFLITLSAFMFTTYRYFILNRQMGVPEGDVAGVVTMSILIYTIALALTAWIAGKISDKIGKRKIFVILATVVLAVGTVMLAYTTDVGMFYVVEAILGAAYGVYIGVDLALVIDVLPNPDDAGKDLGVFNIANALPQTLAPIVAGIIIGWTTINGEANYQPMLWTAGILALIGAVVVLPIKKVK